MTHARDLRRPFVIGSGWRRLAKTGLGHIAALCLPERARAILNGDLSRPPDRIDLLIVAALVDQARRRGEPLDRFAYLHRFMWQDDHAANYHASVADYFTTRFLPNQAVVLDELEKELAIRPLGLFHSLCEIGTGCGAAIDHLSQRLPRHGVSRFIGLDLSAAQVSLNSTRFPACRFETADACDWIPRHAGPGWILFCCGGVLEYLPEAVLSRLLTQTSTFKPMRWIIVEPIDRTFDPTRDFASRPFGWEQTWSHHYPHLVRRAGMQVFYEKEMLVDDLRWQLLIAGT
jgi:hypothetical protein